MTQPNRRRAASGEAITHFYDHLYDEQDECKIWPFALQTRGYGLITFLKPVRRMYYVHVLACQAWNGPKPPKLFAAHGPCHNPSCWNGEHLSWKTPTENARDKIRDGTQQVGARNPRAVLTEDQVTAIRSEYAQLRTPHRTLATKYGVTKSTIGYLLRGKSWVTPTLDVPFEY